MKKIVSAVLVALFATFVCVAQSEVTELPHPHFEIPSSDKEFTVNFIALKGMKEFKFSKGQDDLYVTKAYKAKSHNKEGVITYSLFKDTGVTEESMRGEVFVWTLMCTMNACGSDQISQPTFFKNSDVKGEFNGDCGTYNFIKGPFTNDFLKDYSYAAVDSFYKKGQGLVIRISMSNDLGFFGRAEDGSFVTMEAPYYDFYDAFKFKDREIPTHFEKASFDQKLGINYSVIDGMKEMKLPKKKGVHLCKAFNLEHDGIKGAMVLSLFKDSGVNQDMFRDEVLEFSKKYLLSLMKNPSEVSLPDFQKKYESANAPYDCGFNCLMNGYPQDLFNGKQYVLFESFYKKGGWLLIRVFASDSPAFFGFDESGRAVSSENPYGHFYGSMFLTK
ncbi:MAG: hypothetical protein IJ828_12225 [Treponema sp.]|nr:hypothetical protein [Treponema sp.]